MAVKMMKGQEAITRAEEGGIKIVNVTAPWCGPCKMMTPAFDELSETYDVVKVIVDENQEWADLNGITSIPTTFVYKDGKLDSTTHGFIPKEVLLAKIV